MHTTQIPDYISKISFYHYRINLCVTEEFNLYPFRGTSIRGILGDALRKVSCRYNNDNDCSKCKYANACAYRYFFENSVPETAKNEDEKTGMRKFGFIPAPLVIVPTNNDLNRYKGRMSDLVHLNAGELFTFDLLIMGNANKYFTGQFIEALKYLRFMYVGAKNKDKPDDGKGKLELISIERIDKDNKTAVFYTNDRFIENVKPVKIKGKDLSIEIKKPARIRLHFTSPLTLKIMKHQIRADNNILFNAFYRQLEQKIALNAHYHCGVSELPMFNTNEPLKDEIKLTKSALKDCKITRWSQSQKKQMIMEGVTGDIIFEGDLQDYMPVLLIGQYIGAGKHTNFGFGRYKLFAE